VVVVCVLAYLFAGHRSIYLAQRLLPDKGGTRLSGWIALRDLHEARRPVTETLETKP